MSIINKFRNMFVGKRDYQDDNKAEFRPLPMDDEEKDLADIAKNGDPIPDKYIPEKPKRIYLQDIVDHELLRKFLDDVKVDCLYDLREKYYFICAKEDIEFYTAIFKAIKNGRRNATLQGVDQTQPDEKMALITNLAESLMDDINSLSLDEAHLKYDVLIGSAGVKNIYRGENEAPKKKTSISVAQRNKNLLASPTAAKKFMKDFNKLKSKEMQQRYEISETTMYNLRKRIIAKYGENF